MLLIETFSSRTPVYRNNRLYRNLLRTSIAVPIFLMFSYSGISHYNMYQEPKKTVVNLHEKLLNADSNEQVILEKRIEQLKALPEYKSQKNTEILVKDLWHYSLFASWFVYTSLFIWGNAYEEKLKRSKK